MVAIGGGTGLSILLRGLKQRTTNLTAVVTVADDGGSSGRLRRSLGIPPPGDLRNCLAALAEDEALLTQLFQYRFAEGDGIHGHAFGNLFVTALAGVTGNFERGLLEAGRVLSICGRVFPSTLSNVTLEGELLGERARRAAAGQRRKSNLDPFRARSGGCGWSRRMCARTRARCRRCSGADLIVAGPGSLFTSVLPNLLIREIREALVASRALKIYVCNVATQPGETDGFSVEDHLEAIRAAYRGAAVPRGAGQLHAGGLAAGGNGMGGRPLAGRTGERVPAGSRRRQELRGIMIRKNLPPL